MSKGIRVINSHNFLFIISVLGWLPILDLVFSFTCWNKKLSLRFSLRCSLSWSRVYTGLDFQHIFGKLKSHIIMMRQCSVSLDPITFISSKCIVLLGFTESFTRRVTCEQKTLTVHTSETCASPGSLVSQIIVLLLFSLLTLQMWERKHNWKIQCDAINICN